MSLQDLADYTMVSRYANYIKELQRRETYHEATDRVKNMHLEKYPQLSEEINWAFEHVHNKIALGSQRALQFGGKPIVKKNAKLYNCISTYIDRARVFQETFWLLLCGCGTGFSVQKHHVEKLPEFHNGLNKSSDLSETAHWEIEDSIEGWADALGVLIACYMPHAEFPFFYGKKVEFDFTKIRPKGSPLGSGVGKAPGPDGLKLALEKIRGLLNACLDAGHKKLRPIDAYDIVMHASDAVLSGGVRRCIAKGSRVLVKGSSFKNIEDVKVGDYVSTSGGWQQVKSFFEQGSQKIGRLTHQDGYIDCTPNHRIAVLKDHLGNVEWKEARNLKEGDVLAFVRNDDCEGINKLPDFNYDKPLHSTTCKDIVIPELDENIAWLLGEIHGDGYVRLTSKSGQVSIACEGTNPQKAIELQEQLSRFGVYVKIQMPKPEDNCYKVTTKSKQLATYFDSWLKKPKTDIRVPECIKNASHTIKLAYLQGVLDADGSIGERCQQVVCTVYEDFAKDIQNLLYSLGIVSRFKCLSKDKNNPAWKQKYGVFIVNNEDRDLFNQCSLGHKKFRRSNSQQKSNAFPIEFFENIDREKLPKKWFKHIASNSSRIAYSTWNSVFGESKIVPVAFVSFEETEHETSTYDIEVENNHNFICEGILVHNSATLAIFSPDDQEMLNAKTGDWYYTNPQRARSNNSALLLRNETGLETYHKLFDSTRQFGEPGMIWASNTEALYNPCVEIGLYAYNKDLVSGWQACNLSTINGSKLQTKEDFAVAAKVAAIIGTLQAGYTEFAYLGPVSEEIIRREALLGVSITGIMDHPSITLNPSNLKEMAQLVLETNSDIAAKIGINEASRTTCVKPEGCLFYETKIKTSEGDFTLLEIFEKQGYSYDEIKDIEKTWLELKSPLFIYNEKNELEKVVKLYVNGMVRVYEIPMEDGTIIKATPWHKFKLQSGEWRRCDELKEGDEILSY
jgi:intein/homing endonuclease